MSILWGENKSFLVELGIFTEQFGRFLSYIPSLLRAYFLALPRYRVTRSRKPLCRKAFRVYGTFTTYRLALPRGRRINAKSSNDFDSAKVV